VVHPKTNHGIKRVKSNVFRLTYLIVFIPVATGIKCYCFPTFKDLLALPATRFFERSAKVRAVLFLPNFPAFIFQ